MIPRRVREAGGWVTVEYADLTDHTPRGLPQSIWALWDPTTRTITLHRAMPPRFAQEVFYHELCHVRLADSGLEALLEGQEKLVEALCDLYASARCREEDGDWEGE